MRWAGNAIARGVELILGISGVGYFFLGSEEVRAQAVFLAGWGLLAFCYLAVGIFVVRRLRKADPAVPLPAGGGWMSGAFGRRLGFLLSMAASFTGLNAALSVLADPDDDEFGSLVRGMGVLAMVCAWGLLHAGYARFYSHFTQWRFPSCPHPNPIDFLYFAFTVGVSFAASDVEVHGRGLRWHVMVHSVLSFFYNAIVLAVAVGIITNK